MATPLPLSQLKPFPETSDSYFNDDELKECMEENKTESKISYKYSEDKVIKDLWKYIKSTYSEHYSAEEQNNNVQCFDAWIARGNSTDTFINTAMKYLWRYGKKDGNNKKDLMKALHYIVLAMHVDHYTM